MQCVGTLNLHDYQHNTTLSVQFSSSLLQRPIFISLLQTLGAYVKLLDGLKIFSLLLEAPLRSFA